MCRDWPRLALCAAPILAEVLIAVVASLFDSLVSRVREND
jgi:hypothetical protein